MDDFLAEHVLVADIHRHLLTCHLHRLLIRRAARKVGQRNVQHLNDEAEHRFERDVFAKRHQVKLAVGLCRRRTKTLHAVVIAAIGELLRHADQQVAAIGARVTGQIIEVVLWHFVEKQRQRRFRQNNQARFAGLNHAAVIEQGGEGFVRIPLHVLRNIALQQTHADWRTDRLRPVELLQPEARQPQPRHRQAKADAAQCNRRCADDQQQRHTIYPEQWRKPGQGAERYLRIADRQPGKAGKDPATHPFRQHPQRRNHQRKAPHADAPKQKLQSAHCRREQRQKRAEQRRRQQRQRQRHRAIGMQTDVNPRHARAEIAQAEGKADEQRLPQGLLAPPQPDQPGQGEQRQRKQVKRREAEYR